jgi:biopolymer transport protein TolR
MNSLPEFDHGPRSPLPEIPGVRTGEVTAEINMTPMIDVMLVLLIIFMLITPALATYAVQLPRAVTAAPEKEERVTLGVDALGRFFLDHQREPIPRDRLVERLREAYAARPDDHTLYLKADRTVEYSNVLTAIDAAREAGVRRIGAITEQAAPARTQR